MKHGLIFTASLGIHQIITDFDSLQVVNACTGTNSWWIEAAAIYADWLDLIVEIGNIHFKHCLCEANCTAHEIARFSFESKISCNWLDEPPDLSLSLS